ncbi:hypothetical protein BGZ94_004919 [Podila epigama]|nr:hypothetical protein BGZ94_004919 [Podila epigama]
MVAAPSKKTTIVALSAFVGITTISSLIYLYVRKERRANHDRQLKRLQRSLTSQLLRVDDQLHDIIDGDLRLIQVRVKTLRTHRLYPGDEHVQLPSLGLIQEQDKETLGTDFLQETEQELIRERTLGFDQHPNARKGYKNLEQLLKATHKKLHKLLSRADAIDLVELSEMGDDTGAAPEIDDAELAVFAKVQKRHRLLMNEIQQVIDQVDRLEASIKERLDQVYVYEKLQKIGLEPKDEATTPPTVESLMMEQGVTYVEVTSHNIPEPEVVLAPTEDLQKMKQGITSADMASQHTEQQQPPQALEDDNEKKLEKQEPSQQPNTDILAPTKDLEMMKEGITFAEVVAEE